MRCSTFFLLLTFLFGASLHAIEAKDQKILTGIKVFPSQEKDLIRIHFDRIFDEIPTTQFEKGIFKLSLNNTDFPKKFNLIRVNDGFIRNVRVIRNYHSAIVEIAFAQDDLDVQGRVDIRNHEQSLTLEISRKPVAIHYSEKIGSLFGIKGNDTVENGDKTSPSTAISDSEKFTDGYWGILLQMLTALTLVILMIYLLFWLYRKILGDKFRPAKEKYKVKVASVHPLTPKHKMLMVEVNDKAFACAVSPHNINLISKVSTRENEIAALSENNAEKLNYGVIRAEYQKSLELKNGENQFQPPKKPLPKFGRELLKRVKELRRID